jgi:tetratricopeptide (TPR) repeat protein
MKLIPRSLLYLLLALLTGAGFTSCTSSNNSTQDTSSTPADTTPLGKQIYALDKEIASDPDNAELFHQRAKLLMQKGDMTGSMNDMTRVMQIDSSKSDYWLTMADIHLASAKAAQSKRALEKSLALDPKNKLGYEKLAELYFIAQQYKESIAQLDEVLKLDINNPKAYFMKGMCFRDLGDTTRAVSSFQTSIEQKPDYYEPFMQLALIYHNRNNKLALQYYDGALRINPKSTEALYSRGLWYQENEKNYDKAIQDYTSAVQLNPKLETAHFALGYLHFQYLKVYDQAIKHYNDAVSAAPNWPEAYYNRGLCYEALGNVAAANADYEKALKIRPDYQAALNALGRVSAPLPGK